MNTNHGSQKRTGPGMSADREQALPAHRRVLVSLAVAFGLMLVALAVGLVLSSCGNGGHEPVAEQSATPPAAEVAVASLTDESQAESVGSTSGALDVPATPAPDLDATVTQSVVLPGDSVEVIARATPDAVTVTLWDGYQDRQPFTYDAATNLWRAVYRVPLRASWDRLGLSVTARNDANRWGRVWVFLNMKEEGSVAPDSLGD